MKSTVFVLLLSCVAARVAGETAVLENLSMRLAGSFTSADQAYADKSYHNVTLHCVRIWVHRTDGPWFYAEHALAHAPEQPHRQVVHQLAPAADGAIELRFYSLPDPIALTGAWRDPLRFGKLTPADLLTRAGCTILLRPQTDGSFKGETAGRDCSSDLNGAAYATTELTLAPDHIISWDRGYNAKGRQVWGPLNGGYVFKRVE